MSDYRCPKCDGDTRFVGCFCYRRAPKPKVRIKLVGGIWYAWGLNNSDETRAALVPAITFCKRLNRERARTARSRIVRDLIRDM